MSGPFQFQLIDARNDSAIQKVAGVCSTSDQYRDYINEASRQLMKRGSWFGQECLMRVCTNGCDVVFPRHVGTVLGVRLCNSGQMEIRNNWWAIMAPSCGYGGWSNGNFGSYGYGWGYNGVYGGGYVSNGIDSCTVPIFNQVSGNTGKFIRYVVVNAQDYGKTITLFGKKYGGQPLQQLVDSVTENGLTITAANPMAQTTTLVTKIDSVVRQATVSPAYLYEYDPATTKLRMLAAYEPSETNPRYRRMAIPALSCAGWRTDEYGQKIYQFEALVKLEFVPVVADGDFLLISDFDALAMAIQSIKLREAGDIAGSRAMLLSAIDELNFELRNKSPSDQLSVKVNILGSGGMLTSPI